MTKYYLKFIDHPAFRIEPIRIVIRLIILSIILVLKINYIFKVNVNNNVFKFYLKDLGQNGGSRGLFVYRHNIEPFMKHMDIFSILDGEFLDVGSNHGMYAIAYAAFNPDAKSIAIEPNPNLHKCISNNIKLNGLEDQIFIMDNAISSRNGIAKLDYSRGYGSASISRNFGKEKLFKVQTKTIDKLVSELNLSNISIIKLDVEGEELNALKGAKKTISSNSPIIVLETDEKEFKFTQKFINSLGNYRPYIIKKNKIIKIQKVENYTQNVFFIPNEHKIFKYF